MRMPKIKSKGRSEMTKTQSHRAFRGATDDWLTPPFILKALGVFDLDPCAAPKMPWQTAKRMIAPPQDGLAEPWNGRVWCNPPYGGEVEKWIKKLAAHGQGTALVFARVDTRWWVEHVWGGACAILFFYERLHFFTLNGMRAAGNAGAPSCLIAYGKKDAEQLEQSMCRYGKYIEPL